MIHSKKIDDRMFRFFIEADTVEKTIELYPARRRGRRKGLKLNIDDAIALADILNRQIRELCDM